MITVNGNEHALPDDPRTSLLDFLRREVGLTGTKKGCDHGQCGACTVIVNGMRINSCLTLAVMHDGDEVTTIEGIGTSTIPSPLQRAFVNMTAISAVIARRARFARQPRCSKRSPPAGRATRAATSPSKTAMTDEEIRERMSGNLCRCGAYSNIVEAIREVAGDGA